MKCVQLSKQSFIHILNCLHKREVSQRNMMTIYLDDRRFTVSNKDGDDGDG